MSTKVKAQNEKWTRTQMSSKWARSYFSSALLAIESLLRKGYVPNHEQTERLKLVARMGTHDSNDINREN